MSLLKWLLLLSGCIAILAYTTWWYRTREEPVAARKWAAALRATALACVWLILLNPSVPSGEAEGESDRTALLDASFSMSRRAEVGGTSIWSRGRDSVVQYSNVWLFGGPAPRYLSGDSLPDDPPYSTSLLTPAIRAAAAAGARRVVVYSDGLVTDAREALDEARRRGMTVSLVDLAPPLPDAAISDVSAAGWVQGGDTVEVHAEIIARGIETDSLRLDVVDEAGRTRASAWLDVPQEGRFSSVDLAFELSDPGIRRFVVRLSTPDRDLERRNDQRIFYVRVTEQDLGPVLISLRPDWESSFLIGNLDRLTDAQTTAYAWLADSLVNLDRYRRASAATVQRRAFAAPLLIVHGYGAESPQWVDELVRSSPRVLVFPAGPRGFDLPGWNVRVGPPAAGEWYAVPEVPASPLALDLGGVSTEALPPLLAVRVVEAERAWAPLELRRMRRGQPRPAVVLGRDGGRRFGVATAEGYWRWAFRSGSGRQLYRALWTGVAGWLAAHESGRSVGLEPRRRVVRHGESLHWTVPEGIDSLAVDLLAEDDAAVFSRTAAAGDSLTARLSPGRYRYRARAYVDAGAVSAAEGPAEVEAFSEELSPRPGVRVDSLAATERDDSLARRSGGSRGLATLGWPYLILIALFCGEWALRRWSGLR